MPKYTPAALDAIARHYNVFVRQDDDGNVVGNTMPDAEIGWRPIYADKCSAALDAAGIPPRARHEG